MNTAQSSTTFEEQFGVFPEVVVRAPGRVNLMGDHTDYNDGLVLPMAIDRSLTVAAGRTESDSIDIFSSRFGESALFRSDDDAWDPAQNWSRYVAGVVAMLRRQGISLGGMQIWIGGDLQPGAGLASSAALEVGVARAILELAGRKMSPVALATMCRAAEQEFAGAPCGLMDQLCCTSAQANHAFFLDCRTTASRQIPLQLETDAFVVIDSGVHHEIANSEYANRRRECAIALDALRETGLVSRSLRDLSLQELPSTIESLDEISARRVRHVLTENARVEEAVAALQSQDLAALGWLMNDSHESLRDDFEVSCKELDSLVKIAAEMDGVYGARMTGGGFGGSVIAVAKRDAVDHLAQAIQSRYDKPFGMKASVFPVESTSRVEVVTER